MNSDGKKEILPPKQREVHELEELIDKYRIEDENHCKKIKQMEQQHKQIEQSMFDENEKLRQELIQTKMFLEQYQNSHTGTIKKQSSTIILTNLGTNENEINENQRLKNEIIVLKNKLTTALNKEFKSEDDDTLHSLDQRRIKDLERQVKELGTCLTSFCNDHDRHLIILKLLSAPKYKAPGCFLNNFR
jgi:hypothetical protein